ncbi:MAG: carboxypeptidase-like regulatory domain-containing protein [Bacteroidaceae bacterium]|nr:carboxypeptidase-like regulatory domain-containing protein [Bacteroidaceae bacterium]
MQNKLVFRRCLCLLVIMVAWVGQFHAQVRGTVTDSLTHEPISFVQVYYEGSSIGTQTDTDGHYHLPAPSGDKPMKLVFSSIEYEKKTMWVDAKASRRINVQLKEISHKLDEVMVRPRNERYKRKGNPAVELIRKVIENKSVGDLRRHDWYSYYTYQKMTTSLDDVDTRMLEGGVFKQMPFMRDQIEVDTISGRLILPVAMDETVTRHIWRNSPRAEKSIIMGQKSVGVNNLLSVGEGMTTIMESIFGQVDIYDEDIHLLEKRFVSPIATTGAISFYKYYIMDTLKVDNDSCIHLTFVPQNSQDFGFSGHLYVVKDSSYQVKKCVMTLPQKTGVNFVDEIDILQEYRRLPDGSWAMSTDDLRVSLSLVDMLQSVQVQRTTRYEDYSFAPLEASLFQRKLKEEVHADAQIQDETFWEEHRSVPLTQKESNMSKFVNDIKQMPGFKYLIFGVRALVENFVETGRNGEPSKFDFGPMNTVASYNYIDGLRLRLSGKTTAALNPHLFFNGYIAYGFRDGAPKYKAELEYAFEKKKRLPFEFPRRSVAISHQYDVMAPSDKFLVTDKDNMVLILKSKVVDQMSFIRKTVLTFNYEADNTFSTKVELRHNNDRPVGKLSYVRNDGVGQTLVPDITTTEASVTLRYAPGEVYVNSKQGRMAVNRNASIFTLNHTVGLKGVLGGDYDYHMTEMSVYKRFWLSSWGRVNATLKGGVVWDKVPFPLLSFQPTNQSYVMQLNHFHMMNNMEFLNDHYVSLDATAELNGVLLNRLPLVKHLKWREVFGVNLLYGGLSDKNNPYARPGDDELFLFPERNGQVTSFVMDTNVPYVEYHAGVHNVFKVLRIEYFRRLTYLNLPNVNKHGVRLMLQFKF